MDSTSSNLPSNPYPGPRPFLPDEKSVFFGRERESIDLRDLVLSYRVVLLHSQSGAGKTSLLNASLLPQLEAEKVLRARVGGAQEVPEGVRNVYVFNAVSTYFPAGVGISALRDAHFGDGYRNHPRKSVCSCLISSESS